eukprot:COSAG01_NODE_66530_length_269_cov_66.676471_1_plen_28_part_01
MSSDGCWIEQAFHCLSARSYRSLPLTAY